MIRDPKAAGGFRAPKQGEMMDELKRLYSGYEKNRLPGKLHYAHLLPENATGALWKDEVSPTVFDVGYDPRSSALALEDEFAHASALRKTGGRERALLVGFGEGRRRSRGEAEASLQELRELARTAGVAVVDATLQMRREIDPRYLIGKGKLEDILLRSMQLMADLIVFDWDGTLMDSTNVIAAALKEAVAAELWPRN